MRLSRVRDFWRDDTGVVDFARVTEPGPDGPRERAQAFPKTVRAVGGRAAVKPRVGGCGDGGALNSCGGRQMTLAIGNAIGLGLAAAVASLRRPVPKCAAGDAGGFGDAAWGGEAGGLGCAAWGGDVKPMAACGACPGPSRILLAALAAAVGGFSTAGALARNPRPSVIPRPASLVLRAWGSLRRGGVRCASTGGF